MVSIDQIVVVLTLGLATVHAAAPAPAPAAATAETSLASIPSSQFVFHPTTPALNAVVVRKVTLRPAQILYSGSFRSRPGHHSAWSQTVTDSPVFFLQSNGGSSSQRQLAQWPALKGTGISQTAFNLDACSLRPPHIHPYASGLLYATSGVPWKLLHLRQTMRYFHCCFRHGV